MEKKEIRKKVKKSNIIEKDYTKKKFKKKFKRSLLSF